MTTLKSLVDKLKALAVAHPKINSFGFGLQSDIAAYPMEYPYLWVTSESHIFEFSADNKYQAIEFQFTLRVCDKVSWGTNPLDQKGEESNNGLDALSDTFQILREILNAIMMNSLGNFNDVDMTSTIIAEPLTHVDTGDVNGFEATITLRTKNNFKCETTIGA